MKKTFSVRVVDKMNTYTHSESTCLTSGSFPVRETVGKVRSNETDFNLRGTGNISPLGVGGRESADIILKQTMYEDRVRIRARGKR
jgi:hypothetical protein